MDVMEKSLALHYERRGKIEIAARVPADSSEVLSLAYTPGVAKPCLEIQKDINKSYELTRRWNTVAVVTDGTAATSAFSQISAGTWTCSLPSPLAAGRLCF